MLDDFSFYINLQDNDLFSYHPPNVKKLFLIS